MSEGHLYRWIGAFEGVSTIATIFESAVNRLGVSSDGRRQSTTLRHCIARYMAQTPTIDGTSGKRMLSAEKLLSHIVVHHELIRMWTKAKGVDLFLTLVIDVCVEHFLGENVALHQELAVP